MGNGVRKRFYRRPGAFRWREASPRRPLQRRTVELRHLEHRAHHAARPRGVFVREEILDLGGHHLPRDAELVLEPAALALLSAGGELLPEVIDLVLIGAVDLQRDRLGELKERTAVECGERLPRNLEYDRH